MSWMGRLVCVTKGWSASPSACWCRRRLPFGISGEAIRHCRRPGSVCIEAMQHHRRPLGVVSADGQCHQRPHGAVREEAGDLQRPLVCDASRRCQRPAQESSVLASHYFFPPSFSTLVIFQDCHHQLFCFYFACFSLLPPCQCSPRLLFPRCLKE